MKDLLHSIIYDPWPWYVGGPLIGLTVVLLLFFEEKQLGISSSFQYICGKIAHFNLSYFKGLDKIEWQLFFVIGMIFGGFIFHIFIPSYYISISEDTIRLLNEYGIEKQQGFAPKELFNSSLNNLLILLIGGFCIGFGARYAQGCTAGHAIMGVAQLSKASILATVAFFVGGLIATYFLIPLFF